MRVVVLTVDQHGSRPGPTRCRPRSRCSAAVPTLLAFERTVGDEFQGVLDDPAALAGRARAAAARGRLEHRDRRR